MSQYNPLGNLGISAIVTAIPLFILLYMLGIRRSKGHYAAFYANLAAVLLAIFRWTFLHSLGMCAVIALITLLQAYWLKFMLP